MTETIFAELPHGITLHCRVAGPKGAPALMFLHGFPEAAFVWDEMLAHFGDRYRCIAPNLRGFEQSSAPAEVAAYRVKHLMADLMALIAQQAGGGPLEALIAHDWGGAVAWNLAVQHPEAMKRLVIINSPHPAIFLRALQTSPEQQAASAYMNFLCRPDAEAQLSENDFARMWALLDRMGSATWLTEAVKDQYRAVWRAGLTGALNYYRASPLRPPTAPDSPVMSLSFPPEFVTVRVPTHVIWGEGDVALPASLLDGLQAFVPHMTLTRVPGATHWIVHERPQLVAAEIESALSR
ncbi:MAG: alpha/beta fold hydrolase [Rhizobacter sp.]|nr:alpha/beta fold hydrolase [Rhizobacter sp.]